MEDGTYETIGQHGKWPRQPLGDSLVVTTASTAQRYAATNTIVVPEKQKLLLLL